MKKRRVKSVRNQMLQASGQTTFFRMANPVILLAHNVMRDRIQEPVAAVICDQVWAKLWDGFTLHPRSAYEPPRKQKP